MGQVARLPHVPPTVGTAVDNYLDGVELALTTRRVYTASLTGLAGGLGPDTRLGEVDAATVGGWFRRRYDGVSPATWNRELATLRSAIRWWRAQGWLAENPTGGLARRREVPDRTRALTYRQVETLWRRDVPLREKTLWRLLYETAARTGEILALDVADLDVANKRAKVRSKGGATEWVFWQTGTAQLLPRLLAGRGVGPVFLADRAPTRAVATVDLDPATGRARLSYRRAAAAFTATTGWTLHQLRHSALTHAAEDGDSLVMLLARSRHTSVRSLERYARPGPDAVARHVAERDPARRRR